MAQKLKVWLLFVPFVIPYLVKNYAKRNNFSKVTQ